jgi:uncharacterized protein DUF2835
MAGMRVNPLILTRNKNHFINLAAVDKMSQHQIIQFALNISADQYLNYYRGITKRISVIATDGRRIEFPVQNIQPYLTKTGIQGLFEMRLSPENKFIAIKKIS